MSTIIEMPKLSDTMTVGTVVKWYKEVGDQVENGDILAEIETDKATMELENFEDGVLLKLLAIEGDEVEIGKPLAVVGNAGEEIPELEDLAESKSASSHEEIIESDILPQEITTSTEDISEQKENENIESPLRILASPLAKKIANENNIDLSKVQGTGPNGRITKKDLTQLADVSVSDSSSVTLPPPPTSSIPSSAPTKVVTSPLKSKSVPVSNMRSVIARRLLESKTTIPHFYLQKEINSEPLRIARESINKRLSSGTYRVSKVSINDLILFCCAKAIPQVPEINTSWGEKEIIFHGNVNLAFGVAVDDGLVTPVIRNAELLDLQTLSGEAKGLIEKSRNRKLSPDEMAGSTFTVTNLGMFGVDFFNGIINPPNAAILAVGANVAKPIIAKDGSLRTGETITLGLSCDHRVVDGAIGARFLQVLAETLESPASLLV
jgi:pyruvate dehydrogenase E2 component (dihydrolipoamide acetyltransferase)